ncbi:carbohydrate-binding module family 13 protein [Suillus brevipes Sb2]|nr:carbohydrate-binding module family 13 protein [Suillus brevipes Sb2]
MARIENQHTYSLISFQGGTAVTDISIVDNYSTVGYRPYNGSDFKLNQAWTFLQAGGQHEWFIKSSCSGKYLGVEGNPYQGSVVVVVSNPFKWVVTGSNVEHAKGIRISAHGTDLSLDLNFGNPANYTKIHLWGSWAGDNQIWALTERVSTENWHTDNCRNQGGIGVQDTDSKACFHPRLVQCNIKQHNFTEECSQGTI